MGSQQVGTQKKLAENLTPCLNDELRLFPLFPFQKLLWPSRIFRAGSETHVCLLLRLPISLNKGTFPFPTKFSLLSIGFFFFFFWLYWVYVAVHRGYSRSSGQASHYGSFSYCRAQALSVRAAAHRLNRCGSRAYEAYSSVAGVHRLCCSVVCAILPDECSNPCPLYWQPDSYPLCHQASPSIGF